MRHFDLSLLAALTLMTAGGYAAERPRPSLLITRQDVTRAKELIATCPWAAGTYRDVREAAEQGNSVAQGLVFQIDGNRQSADRAKAKLLAAGSAFKPGGPYHWGVGVNEAITYDLVAEACTPAERRQIEDYLRRLCQDAIPAHQRGIFGPVSREFGDSSAGRCRFACFRCQRWYPQACGVRVRPWRAPGLEEI